ncbi:unnamed protein product [Paramecium octaurelia]|uniref:Uncharacterized protein n=1 Tax=Paramecium octaurelia TaxID=43137 RepID=A0A8S1SZC9_PAROT|nr:unnamed protein product [Paramecium octaurelia]
MYSIKLKKFIFNEYSQAKLNTSYSYQFQFKQFKLKYNKDNQKM